MLLHCLFVEALKVCNGFHCNVLGIRDTNTQTELLKVRDLSLEKCVDICRAAENATNQNKLIRPNVVHKVGLRRETEQQEVKECKLRETHHRFRKEDCPASVSYTHLTLPTTLEV